MLGTSDAWSTSHSSQRTSEPANQRTSVLYCRLSDFYRSSGNARWGVMQNFQWSFYLEFLLFTTPICEWEKHDFKSDEKNLISGKNGLTGFRGFIHDFYCLQPPFLMFEKKNRCTIFLLAKIYKNNFISLAFLLAPLVKKLTSMCWNM